MEEVTSKGPCEKLLEITLPIRLESSANKREHWAVTYKRNKMQSNLVYFCFKNVELDLGSKEHIKIVLTRIGKKFLDYDNLVYGFKSIRDTLCDCLFPGYAPGQADKDVYFEYVQERRPTYAVRIEIKNKGPV